MDSREAVGWVLMTVVASLIFLLSNSFVNAVQQEIAEGSVPMIGSYLDSATDAALDRFRILGQVGRAVTGFTVIVAISGGAFRAVTQRSRGLA